MGWSPTKPCFRVPIACCPRSPLDIPVVEDDEGPLGVGGEDGLEGVALQKERGRWTPGVVG